MRVVTVSRRPCEKGSATANVVKYDAGALNINACRIGFASTADLALTKLKNPGRDGELTTSNVYGADRPQQKVTESGRYPANAILHHRSGCKQTGSTTLPGYTINRWTDGAKPFGGGAGHEYESEEQPPESIAVWTCAEGCPVAELGAQSGDSHERLRKTTRNEGRADETQWRFKPTEGTLRGHGDSGTAARYFKQVQELEMNELPEELIDYLITMIAPPPSCEPVLIIRPNLDNYAWEEHEDSSVHGLITMGNPESHMEDIDRVLRPGAHLLVVAPEDEPAGFTAACAVEDFGYEIRDAIALLDAPDDFHYVAKASSSERNAGILLRETETGREVQNAHPTVKPIDVMEALLHDVPEGALVVDPFMGSGTTGIACLRTGHNFVGIDQDESFLRIADQRIRHWDRAKNAWDGATIKSEAKFEESSEPMELGDLFGISMDADYGAIGSMTVPPPAIKEDDGLIGDCPVCEERDTEIEIKEKGERLEVCGECAKDRNRVAKYLLGTAKSRVRDLEE